MKEIKVVGNALRGNVVRKLVATGDLRKSISLSLFDYGSKYQKGIRGESKAGISNL